MIFALEYDRPRHTDHRRILTDLAGPRATIDIEPTVRAHAKRLIEESVADGYIDLGADYAYPLALDVIFSLIGALEDIKKEMELLAESLFLYRRPMPDGSDPAQRLRSILERLVTERTAEPDDSWISQIVASAKAPDGLTDAEVRGGLVAVLTGGRHSTARGIACLLAHLVTDADLQRLVRNDRSRIGPLVEESLRLNTPLRWFARTAAADVQIGGQLVRSGQRAYLLYAGANQDPARFADPDRA